MRGDRKSVNKVKKGRATPVSFRDCRPPFNHDWVETEAERNPKGGGWYLTMRCSQCGTIRTQIVDRYGNIEKGSYKYPEFYRDTDGWTRSQWRVQYLLQNGDTK
jgi:hypothetical protein